MTFWSIFRFEITYWLKAMMVWVFLTIMTLLMLALLVNDEPVMQDLFFSNAYRNSSFVIQRLYGMTAVFGCLMVTAFVNAAASRDFACQTQQLIFTKPISKGSYLMGRFWGSLLVAMIPMLGASLSVIIAEQFHSGPQWGPSQWHTHLWSILVIALPNTFFVGAIVFAIAVWTRSALASFLGILGLLVGLSISGALVTFIDNKFLAAMVDPFADTAIALQTEYWTVEDKNTQTVALQGAVLWNRVFWTLVGVFFLSVGYWRFSFTLKEGWISRILQITRQSFETVLVGQAKVATIPTVRREYGIVARLRQWLHLVRMEIGQTWRSPIFICIMIGILFVTLTNMSVKTSGMFGVSTLPVTFSVVETVRDSLFQFQLVLITFYAGVFVWKERDAKLDEIYDALPIPTGMTFAAKLLAMYGVIFSVILVGIVCGLLFQTVQGFTDYEVGLYLVELMGWDMVRLTCLITLAFFCHVVSANKYVGYFVYIGLFVANVLVWELLEVRSNMFQYGDLPNYVYSDLFGREPYLPILRWFATYWMLLAAVMAFVCVLLWPRGKERGVARLRLMPTRWIGAVRWGSLATVCLWALTAGWLGWNTMFVNTLESRADEKQAQADYETQLKSESEKPQPRVSQVRYEIDLYPERRELKIHANQTLENRTDQVIEEIQVSVDDTFKVAMAIENATLIEKKFEDRFWVYSVDPPLQPGQSLPMTFDLHYAPQGIENSLEFSAVVQNGSFFNSSIMPQIGYQTAWELKDKDDRKEFDLEEGGFPKWDPDNLAARGDTYISNNSDWVDIETVFSTSGDQVAVAPGSLIKRWEKDGRNYFHYKVDHPSLNFYSFVSARFKVATRQMQDIDLEVYYHPEHEWNVDLMLRSMQKSLDYYTQHFGPYEHKQARIVEFPRVATFAQAFPGTMPYSEGIGFIADLNNLEDDIDMVYYVVAHEMAHQWWAHQVIGANMQGATVLSETLAQYSALMVMEQEYGRDMMRKFLQHEMDNYLRARGRSKREEQPLKTVEFDQGYVHYNKGSLAMYLLRETIGEDKVNQALKQLIDQFAYQGPPYPTSADLLAQLRSVTPPAHQGLIDDLFEHITLFDNRTKSATWKKTGENQFEVKLEIEFRKLQSDGFGKEQEVALNDWIEIGAFAKPESGKTYGETLHRQRVRITSSPQTFTFTVSEPPALAGVDPISLLIDRNKQDNMIEPDEQGGE